MDARTRGRVLGVCLILVAGLWACSDETAPGPQLCGTDADCPEDQSCVDGVCRVDCTVSTDCPDGMQCVSGHCLTPCSTNADCPPGEECENGYCVLSEVEDGGTDGDGGTTECIDEDEDGYGANCELGPDCDDSDRTVHPNAPEVCHDGIDNDCDGSTDEADCGCEHGDRRACYTGPHETEGVGLCRPGVMVCGDDKEYGPCQGEQTPVDEVCDGEDNDCDGDADEDLLNRCGECAPPDDQLVEVCGDGMDNDCDGEMDENCSCDPNCQCDDPGSGSNCVCHPPVDQPCYSGPPITSGVGICHGGVHDCVEQGDDYVWTECEGEVLPGIECDGDVADGLDNDCDGYVDETCLPDVDQDGFRPPEDCDDTNPDINPDADEVCNGVDDNCNGILDEGVTNACGLCGPEPEEVCADGLDNDCDGAVDENCGGCSGSETRPCYRGPDGTQGIGLCAWGEMTCIGGEFWSECEGDVIPEAEICDGADNDCDDEVDEQWAIGSNLCGWCDSTEECDGIDNDCDGWTDEGVTNACGECAAEPVEVCDGQDNDCDGLTDEGVLTACGTCPDVPCYEENWDTPGDCDADLTTCDGTEPDPGDPDSVTLGQGTVRTPFIYISVNGRDQVAKLDTETGEKIWQVASHGDDPSRTAVALDFSVWVGNRGSSNINNAALSNGVHLDADGNKICMVDAPGRCRGVAIDGDGNVWFGTYEGQTLYKVHGENVVDTGCTSPPCCELLGTLNVGVYVYGLAIDGNGYLWTASSPNTVQVNTATMTIADTVSHDRHYGIAIDQQNNVWLGDHSGSGSYRGVHRINDSDHSVFYTGSRRITAVTVDAEGYIWGSAYSEDLVVKLDPTTGAEICTAPVQNGDHPHGVAVDANDKIWVPNRYGGYANRYVGNCVHDGSFPVDPGYELYTYSDMTGMQLRMVTTREGHWIQNFDSGYSTPIWHSANWQATVPANTSVRVSFVSADSEAELITNHSPMCGPFDTPPADLYNACPDLSGHRWLSADVQLNTTQDGVRPTFSGLQVFWSY